MLKVGDNVVMNDKYHVAKQNKCKEALEVCEKLKQIGCCHNYQLERGDLVEWIDEVNNLIRNFEEYERRS